MAVNNSGKHGISAIELETVATTQIEAQYLQKVQDGDEALKILHEEFELYTEDEEKRVRRKIDVRLVLLMLIVNGLQFVDKSVRIPKHTLSQSPHSSRPSWQQPHTESSQAHLVGQEFCWLISIFYVGYLIAQYPTNVLMQRFPTGKYLAINFTLWGMSSSYAFLSCWI